MAEIKQYRTPEALRTALETRLQDLARSQHTEIQRLRQVFKKMESFGDPLQYSAYECQLTPGDLVSYCEDDLGRIFRLS
jgi:hypothetical protein